MPPCQIPVITFLPLAELSLKDLLRVGGKNASLGELIKNLSAVGVRVPGGFATTTDAYRRFLTENNLNEKFIPPLPDWTLKTCWN